MNSSNEDNNRLCGFRFIVNYSVIINLLSSRIYLHSFYSVYIQDLVEYYTEASTPKCVNSDYI